MWTSAPVGQPLSASARSPAHGCDARDESTAAPMMRAAVAFGVLASARKDGRGCRCDDLAGPRTAPRVYDVPVGFRTHNLSSQVVLMKVPETGSSTASNLLVELAAKRQRPTWSTMGNDGFEDVVVNAPIDAPKWAIGHKPWGPWLARHFDPDVVDLVTTARDPGARLASWFEKRRLRGDGGACADGANVALKFWGLDASKSPEKTAKAALDRFDEVIVTERYNESLVAFALRRRLQLGDVLPPLAKYHAPSSSSSGQQKTRDDATKACEKVPPRALASEKAVHDAASARLDATFDELRTAGVDVDALVETFRNYLDAAMTSGARHVYKTFGKRAESGSDTLIMNACFRKCAILGLDRAVVLRYGGPPHPRKPHRDRLRYG